MDTGNMFIALYEPEKDLLYFELAFIDGVPVDIRNEPKWAPRSGGNGRTEWIIRNKTPLLTFTKVDAEKWYDQPNARNYIEQTFASWLGVPIMFGNEVLGVIATYNKTEEYKYDPDDLKILSLMGRQAAIALQNARLIGRLDTMRELGEDLSSSLSI
jgi:transcriptional regulator with GAF, ATPase, and Fis domain